MGRIDSEKEKSDALGWLFLSVVVAAFVILADFVMALYGRLTLSETGGLIFKKHPWVPFGFSVVIGHIAMTRTTSLFSPWVETGVVVGVIALLAAGWEIYYWNADDPLVLGNWAMLFVINAGLFFGSYVWSMSPQFGSLH